jgi:hypothetical protein
MRAVDKRLLKDIIIAIGLICFGILIKSCDCRGDTFLEAREVSFDAVKHETLYYYYFTDSYGRQVYGQYDSTGDDYRQEYWTLGVAMNVNLDFYRTENFAFTWDNKVRGDSTNNQFRHVAWNYEMAFEMYSKVALMWQHESRHHLESQETKGYYPLKDSLGVRLFFLRK